jgi:hypothetical protein
MTDLRPYHVPPPPTTPLTVGARFIRGFKRIGIIAATLVALGGVAITVIIAIDQQRSAERRFEQAVCVARLVRDKRPFKMKTYDQTKIDYDESGCPGYSFYGEPLEAELAFARSSPPAPLEYAVQPFFIGLAISLASGAASFCCFWLIGWLCAGFTRD